MQSEQTNVFEEGKLLLINKPFHWTSFDVIRKIRPIIKIKKMGHAGTLDPLATGLLIICTGKFTKKINDYMSQEKEYTGSFTLGATTASYDLETDPENFKSYNHISTENVYATTALFTGEIQQVPPVHSAIKKDGRRVYKMARKGIDVKLEPRTIHIKEFEITSVALPIVQFRVVCSTGTYIRSLANDFGEALGCGAHLSSLCRTRIGEFTLENAVSIDGLRDMVKEKMDN